MIRAIIVDDEQHCIDRLTHLLSENHKDVVEILATNVSVSDAISSIKKFQPELVFLDVQIKDETGFELLKRVPQINFELIFTTAFEKYAVQAFKFSALDYLLKPIDEMDLQAAIGKVKTKISKDEINNKVDVLLYNFVNQHSETKRITVPTINGFEFIQLSEIIRCQSDVNYTTIFLKNKSSILVAKTLKEFEELLSDYNFFRIHNSHLINISCIKSYNKGKGGFVTLQDGSQIEVSTRRKEDFIKRISERNL